MVKIEVVIHAWARKLPHVSAMLCYTLSSRWINPPKKCEVLFTVCCEPKDGKVLDIVAYFSKLFPIKTFIMADEFHLGRRSIGRNYAAKQTKADIVWFADVDQWYTEGCFDRLAKLKWPEPASMIWPKTIKIHKDHATGDAAVARAGETSKIMTIRPDEFEDKHYNRAIGGVQIVRGSFARQYGYLGDSEEWQQPAKIPFSDFRDDVHYRKFCESHGGVQAVDLPGIFRLRHSAVSYKSGNQTQLNLPDLV